MTEQVKSKKRSHGTIPRKEADLISIATGAANVWETRPALKLIWTSSADLKEATNVFKNSFKVRNETKSSRIVITQDLKSVNTDIDQSVSYVKGYISDKYSKKNAPAYYSQFGMVIEKGAYKMPSDNDRRLQALEQMVKAIENHGLAGQKYGEQYWKEIYIRFAEAKSKATSGDSTSATHVSIKADRKAMIQKILNALVSLIKANYPDTWKEELRVWGFQKEKY